MRTPTPEIMAFFAFWAVKNAASSELGEEVQGLAQKLHSVNESGRHRLCERFIRDAKKK